MTDSYIVDSPVLMVLQSLTHSLIDSLTDSAQPIVHRVDSQKGLESFAEELQQDFTGALNWGPNLRA